MTDPIKEKEHAERIEAFKRAAHALRTARDNLRSSERKVKDATAQLKDDQMTLDGAHVAFNRQAEGLGFKAPSGSGLLTFQENLLAITGHPAPVSAPAPTRPQPVPPIQYNPDNVACAIGADLDRVATRLGMPRMHYETDAVLRTRLQGK